MCAVPEILILQVGSVQRVLSFIMLLCWKAFNCLLTVVVAEAHPEVILQESGATEEAYKKDLAYLKEKVGDRDHTKSCVIYLEERKSCSPNLVSSI